MASDILIIDDEADIRDLVAGILEDEGYATRTARDSDDAAASIAARRPNLIFLDIWLQGSRLDGLQMLANIKTEHPELPVVMISGHGNIETAVAAIKQGAYDFIEKPFKADRLVLVADRALETSRLKREVKELKQLAPHPATLVADPRPPSRVLAPPKRLPMPMALCSAGSSLSRSPSAADSPTAPFRRRSRKSISRTNSPSFRTTATR